jgi:hypothetical protein
VIKLPDGVGWSEEEAKQRIAAFVNLLKREGEIARQLYLGGKRCRSIHGFDFTQECFEDMGWGDLTDWWLKPALIRELLKLHSTTTRGFYIEFVNSVPVVGPPAPYLVWYLIDEELVSTEE